MPTSAAIAVLAVVYGVLGIALVPYVLVLCEANKKPRRRRRVKHFPPLRPNGREERWSDAERSDAENDPAEDPALKSAPPVPRAPTVDGIAGTNDPKYQTLNGMGQDCFGNDKAPGGAARPGAPRPPQNAGVMAETHDPHYQTLNGLGADCFGPDKAGGRGGGAAPAGLPVPGQPGIVNHDDPKYQTLAGMGQDCFGADKAAGRGGGQQQQGLPVPRQPGIANHDDPKYQTLAGMGQDCFGADKAAGKGVGGGAKPGIAGPGAAAAGLPKPGAPGIAQTNDPNYQTLAKMNNNDCFGADKKAGGGGVAPGAPAAGAAGLPKPGAPGVAQTNDPNYQTLAKMNNNDCFGADKKAGGGGVAPGAPAAGAAGLPKPGAPGVAQTNDPNYQTLAKMNNNDCFGADKKGAGAAAAGAGAAEAKEATNLGGGAAATAAGNIRPPTDCKKKAQVNDPKYQTLAAVNADCFGPDKKAALQ